MYDDKNHHLGIDIERLIELTKEKSYPLPRGMTREERRKYCKFISDVNRLIELSKEESYTIPNRLSREDIITWAKNNKDKKNDI